MEKNSVNVGREGDSSVVGSESSIIKDDVFIWGACGLLSGVFLFENISYVSIALSLICVFGLLVFGISKKYLVVTIFFTCLLLGCVRVSFVPKQPTVPEGKFEFEGVVYEYPEERDASMRYGIRVSRIGSLNLETPISFLVTAERFPEALYGDRVVFSGTLQKPGTITQEDGRTFDYARYIDSSGYGGSISFAKIISNERVTTNIKTFLFNIRRFVSDGIDRSLPEPSAGLLKGILIGEKHAMGKSAEDVFRRAGLSHIVVLSGYNVMIVVGFVLFALRRLVPKYAPYGAFFALCAFIVLTGGDSTAIRAALMASVMIVGLLLRRTYVAGRALSIAVLVFVLWDPQVATGISFLLSVSATFAVVYVAPYVRQFLSRIPEAYGIREGLATTIAAQIFVAPILLHSIGSLPLFSIVSNLLVLPFVPLAMVLGGISALFGMVNFLPVLIGFPAHVVLVYIHSVADLFSSIPFLITLPPFSGWFVFVVYLVLLLFVMNRVHGKPSA